MGTKVLKLEGKSHGGWQFETSDARGNVLIRMNGVFHEVVLNKKITRTFEMENTPFGIQLDFLEFESVTDDTSLLKMHSIYRSVAVRDQILKLPFVQGINMAHNELQKIVSKLK
jgi:uncharacterized protein YndB with AHSA1/START domain